MRGAPPLLMARLTAYLDLWINGCGADESLIRMLFDGG
jgi:hypothetical protein